MSDPQSCITFDYAQFRAEFNKLKRTRKAEPQPRKEPPVTALHRVIRDQVHYDDALRCGRWRLEYLCLEYGTPHYRLFDGERLVGIQNIRTPRLLPRVQRNLASYLISLGFKPEHIKIIPHGAKTPLEAGKYGVPSLFEPPKCSKKPTPSLLQLKLAS